MPIRLAISVEGKTEVNFVEKVIRIHLQNVWENKYGHDTYVVDAFNIGGRIKTSQVAETLRNIIDIPVIDNDIDPDMNYYDTITTFYDYYAYKDEEGNDISGIDVVDLEKEILDEVSRIVPTLGELDRENPYKFIPYVQMYEFEGLLFSDPESASRIMRNKDIKKDMEDILLNFKGNPEKINNNRRTAPSKRLNDHSVNYKKTRHGHAVAEKIGIQKIKDMCPRFKEWIEKLEKLK